MKNRLLVLITLVFFCACDKKDKETITPPPQEWLLVQMVRDTDSVRFTYNDDGTVKRFAQFSRIGGLNDSSRVIYAGGKASRFVLLDADGLDDRSDIAFDYAADKLVRINYYNYGADQTWQVTDHDSLVYKDGKLAEWHRINGGSRNSFSKYTWENDNLVKDEQYSVVGEEATMDIYHKYTYNDQPNAYNGVKADFLFLFTRGNVTYLSAKQMVKHEVVYQPSGVTTNRMTNVYEFDMESKMLKKLVTSAEDLLAGGTQIVETTYSFIKK